MLGYVTAGFLAVRNPLSVGLSVMVTPVLLP